jgi:hypothetical protein
VTTTDSIHILWRTPAVISARVRAGGIYDVAWTRLAGWSCTCLSDEECAHVKAVKALVREGA